MRLAILMLLAEGARNGYELMRDVEERSSGAWRPSPGSVYPTLASLADEHLVRSERVRGRRVFAITDEGRASLSGAAAAPWTRIREAAPAHEDDLRHALDQLIASVEQIAQVGSPEQCRQAREKLDATRRALYLMLAD